METALNTPKVSFEDFYEVPNLKFDIEKLNDINSIYLKNLSLETLITRVDSSYINIDKDKVKKTNNMKKNLNLTFLPYMILS